MKPNLRNDIEKLQSDTVANTASWANNVTQVTKNTNDILSNTTKIGNMGNTKTFKGSCLFANLPLTGMLANDYWYVTDKTSNYCYNGSAWIDIGNNVNVGAGTIVKSKLALTVADGTDLLNRVNYADVFNTSVRGYDYCQNDTTPTSYTHVKDIESDGYLHYKLSVTDNTVGLNPMFNTDVGVTGYLPFDINKILQIDYLATGRVLPQATCKFYDVNKVQVGSDFIATGDAIKNITTTNATVTSVNITLIHFEHTMKIASSIDVFNFRISNKSDLLVPANLKDRLASVESSMGTNNTRLTAIESSVTVSTKTIFKLPQTFTTTSGTTTIENYKKKNNDYSIKWLLSQVGSATFTGLNIACKTTDTVGIWVYLSKNISDRFTATDGIAKITLGSYVSTDIYCGYKWHNGWNYISFVTGITFIDSLVFSFSNVKGEYTLIFDSIELNYKKKPNIMLCFDDASANGKEWDLLNSYGYRGTFALGNGAYPGLDASVMTMLQFKDLMKKGWDYSIYYGTGTMPASRTLETSHAEWITFIQNQITLLENVGIFNPFAYFSNANESNAMLINVEKELGFRLNRSMIDGYNNIIDYFDKDSFETTCIGLIDSNINAVKTLIDTAIANGRSLSIFSHKVIDSGTVTVETLTATWVAILDYIKTYTDAKAVEVITYRELYQRNEPSDYENYINQRRVKEYQYLLSKVTT